MKWLLPDFPTAEMAEQYDTIIVFMDELNPGTVCAGGGLLLDQP